MPKRFPTEIRTQAMEQLRAGQEIGGVAKELGVHSTTVRYWRTKLGLPRLWNPRLIERRRPVSMKNVCGEDLSFPTPDGDPRTAREGIAKHVGKITLKPVVRTYIATGIWDWLRVSQRAAAMVVPGARIVCNSHKIPFHIELAA
jgi:transposase